MSIARGLRTATAVLFVLVPAGVAGAALPPPDAGFDAARVLEAARVPACVGEREQLELARYRDLVAAAESVEAAREKAIWPSRVARRALWLVGLAARDAGSLDATRARLLAYEQRVAHAPSAQAAAAEFEGLVRLAGDVRVGGSKGGGCTYDATEVIGIILGFLLFIIPGIILLVVFC